MKTQPTLEALAARIAALEARVMDLERMLRESVSRASDAYDTTHQQGVGR